MARRHDSGMMDKVQADEVLDTRTVVALTFGVFAAVAVLAAILVPLTT